MKKSKKASASKTAKKTVAKSAKRKSKTSAASKKPKQKGVRSTSKQSGKKKSARGGGKKFEVDSVVEVIGTTFQGLKGVVRSVGTKVEVDLFLGVTVYPTSFAASKLTAYVTGAAAAGKILGQRSMKGLEAASNSSFVVGDIVSIISGEFTGRKGYIDAIDPGTMAHWVVFRRGLDVLRRSFSAGQLRRY